MNKIVYEKIKKALKNGRYCEHNDELCIVLTTNGKK